MNLRPASPADAEMILRWRNDPDSIAACRRMRPLTMDEIGDYLVRGFVAERNGVPVGLVRWDRLSEISWMVAPGARGEGVGHTMLGAFGLGGAHIAFIKPGNVASQKIAAAAGFARVDGLEAWRRG